MVNPFNGPKKRTDATFPSVTKRDDAYSSFYITGNSANIIKAKQIGPANH